MSGGVPTPAHDDGSAAAERKLPVIELFGPTIQGEGHLIGTPCHFVRLGGCDYRCSWCDSKYAVLPTEVKQNATPMTAREIIYALGELEGSPGLVVISGGNPALHHLGDLVDELHDEGYRVTIETQGTIWREWMARVDHVTVSPKPPSSGMRTNWGALSRVVGNLLAAGVETALKVVVMDEEADLRYAAEVFERYPQGELMRFLSTGNDVGVDTTQDLLEKMARFVERTLRDERFRDVRMLPQLHVLLWGNARGV